MAKYWCVVKHFLHYEEQIESKLKTNNDLDTANIKDLKTRLKNFKDYRMTAMDFLLGRNNLHNGMQVTSDKDISKVEQHLMKNLYTSTSNNMIVKHTDKDFKRKITMKDELMKYGTYGIGHVAKRVTQDVTDGMAPVAGVAMSDLVGFGLGVLATIGSVYVEDKVGTHAATAMAVMGTGLFIDAAYDKANIGSYITPTTSVVDVAPVGASMRMAPRAMRNSNEVVY